MDQIPTYLFIPSALNWKSLFINADNQIRRFKYELFINVLSSTKPPILILLTDCKCSTERTVWKNISYIRQVSKLLPNLYPRSNSALSVFKKSFKEKKIPSEIRVLTFQSSYTNQLHSGEPENTSK